MFDVEKAGLLQEIAMLKDSVNQARGESSAKDEEIEAFTSAKGEMEAAYAQLEKDMADMEENYKTHLMEIDARTRMELMKEYKIGEHLNWKPDEVIDDYYLLFPESISPEPHITNGQKGSRCHYRGRQGWSSRQPFSE